MNSTYFLLLSLYRILFEVLTLSFYKSNSILTHSLLNSKKEIMQKSTKLKDCKKLLRFGIQLLKNAYFSYSVLRKPYQSSKTFLQLSIALTLDNLLKASEDGKRRTSWSVESFSFTPHIFFVLLLFCMLRTQKQKGQMRLMPLRNLYLTGRMQSASKKANI